MASFVIGKCCFFVFSEKKKPYMKLSIIMTLVEKFVICISLKGLTVAVVKIFFSFLNNCAINLSCFNFLFSRSKTWRNSRTSNNFTFPTMELRFWKIWNRIIA